MRKATISSLIVIATILLSACSSPIALLQGGTTNTAKTDTNLQAVQPAQPVTYTKPVIQTTAPVIPASDVSGLLAAYEGALSSVYQAVNPSVVNIRVVSKASASDLGSQQFPFPSIPGMPNIPNNALPQSQPYQEALGSGFVWDQQGYIITNNHVIDGADKIEITFSDGTIVPAKLVGADPDSDLAVLKVDVAADKLIPVQFLDSTQVKVGDLAIAIGNPFGLEGTMTTGIISAVGRTMPAGLSQGSNGPTYSIPDIIQTDASINPGNSGGVLVNDQGLVMGVTFAIESPTRSSAGIGFVIPSSLVTRVVPSLIQNGKFQHTYLGITGGTLTPTLAQAMKLDPTQRGVLVSQVNSGTPAEKAGLHGSNGETTIDGQQVPIGGDVIIALDGKPVTKMDDVIAYLADSTTVGQKITLTILRNGKQQDVQVTLEARPAPQTAQTTTTSPQTASAKVWMGITGGTLTPDIAQAMNLKSDQAGVLVVTVQSGSPANSAGLKGSDHTATVGGQQVPLGGDVIVAIDGQPIGSMDELSTLLQNYNPGDKITVTVLRGSQQLDLSVTLAERPATQ